MHHLISDTIKDQLSLRFTVKTYFSHIRPHRRQELSLRELPLNFLPILPMTGVITHTFHQPFRILLFNIYKSYNRYAVLLYNGSHCRLFGYLDNELTLQISYYRYHHCRPPCWHFQSCLNNGCRPYPLSGFLHICVVYCGGGKTCDFNCVCISTNISKSSIFFIKPTDRSLYQFFYSLTYPSDSRYLEFKIIVSAAWCCIFTELTDPYWHHD